MKIALGAAPRRSCVTKEDEIGHYASGIDCDHLAHATESGILLLVVSNVAQRRAPNRTKKINFRTSKKLHQVISNFNHQVSLYKNYQMSAENSCAKVTEIMDEPF